VLSARDLHAYYGDSYVLHGISLKAEPGRLTVLMGRNGVGKTTILRAILGLTPPRRGSVQFVGEELTRLSTHQIAKRGLSIVPQGRRVFRSLTVREHLLTAARARVDQESWTIERVFDLFPPLKKRIDQRARYLSGGEQSMLAIARALRTEPRCLLMDEPTEGLAPMYVDIVLEVVRELKQQRNLALLMVLPELPLALAVADYVYVMRKGEVAFEGPVQELADRKDVQEQHIGIG
jgi:branched-chain amino acid transport system ATP-binding protein